MVKKVFLFIVGAIVVFFGALYLLALFSGQPEVEGLQRISISGEGSFQSQDICFVGNRLFFVGWNKPGIYEIRNDSLIPFNVGHGIGEGKFREPVRLKEFEGNLYALDLQNRQVLSFDTSGNFLGSYPKRTSEEFLFLDEKDREYIASDFCITESLFVVAYGKIGNQHLYIGNRIRGEVKKLPVQFSLISRIECLRGENSVYVADTDNRTVYHINSTGEQLGSVGINGTTSFGFNSIEDFVVTEDGKVYVLDVIAGNGGNHSGKGAIHIFSEDLAYESSLFVDEKVALLRMPKAFTLDSTHRRLMIVNSDATQLYAVDIGN